VYQEEILHGVYPEQVSMIVVFFLRRTIRFFTPSGRSEWQTRGSTSFRMAMGRLLFSLYYGF